VYGLWQDASERTLLVEECGVYSAPWWNSPPICLLAEHTAGTFRWSVEFVSEDGFIVELCGVERVFRVQDAGSRLELDGTELRRVGRAPECRPLEVGRYGIEVRTAADMSWARTQ
jgi:hypothetical protein